MIQIAIAEDVKGISQLIGETLFYSNGKDYARADLENLAQFYSCSKVAEIGQTGHLYAAYCNETLVGCGAVLPRDEESCLLSSLFVRSSHQGRGIGKKLMETLEADSLVKGKRCVLFASITAVAFYEKLGYSFQGGRKQLNENQVYPMMK